MVKNGLNTQDIYDLIDRKVNEVNESLKGANLKIDKVDDKVDGVSNQVSNINGRLYMIPTIISIAFGLFTFILNLMLKR